MLVVILVAFGEVTGGFEIGQINDGEKIVGLGSW